MARNMLGIDLWVIVAAACDSLKRTVPASHSSRNGVSSGCANSVPSAGRTGGSASARRVSTTTKSTL